MTLIPLLETRAGGSGITVTGAPVTYQVERMIGEGAFAEVYRVEHPFLGKQAMKIFKLPMSLEEAARQLEEASLLSRLGHPNIIRVFTAGTMDIAGRQYGFFTMEYVPGGTVENLWRSHRTEYVPVDTAVEIVRQACQGLSVAHSEQPPIIHRDVKPQNLLVGYDGAGMRVRVSDFGLAKRANPLKAGITARGTVAFKAPEVFEDSHSDSCAGDVWALGCTLYLLLTDRLPCTDPTQPSLGGTGKLKRPATPASSHNTKVDGLLDRILLRALALNPGDRYPNAKEFLTDLNHWRPASTGGAGASGGSPSDGSKGVLGLRSPQDTSKARAMASEAVRLSRQPGKLAEAADLLEKAINALPELRREYERLVQLWRRGVVM